MCIALDVCGLDLKRRDKGFAAHRTGITEAPPTRAHPDLVIRELVPIAPDRLHAIVNMRHHPELW
jgi:hypothetical protein